MQQTYLNSFETLNTNDLSCRYDLYKIRGVEPSIENYEKSVNSLVKKISSEINNVVVPTSIDGVRYLAILASANPPHIRHSVGVHIFELQKVDSSKVLNFSTTNHDELLLCQGFLRGAIKGFLMRSKKELWGDGSKSYFTKDPLYKNKQVEMYGGFSYDVIVTTEGKFLLTIDITARYVSPYTIKDMLDDGASLNPSPRKPVHCLYEMCQNWFPVEVTGILNIPVSEQHFSFNGEDRTVYGHTLMNASPDVLEYYKSKLKPSDVTVTFRYPNKKSMVTLHAASSLARPKFGTEHEYVKEIHRKSIIAPDKRISIASSYLRKYMNRVIFDGKRISFSNKPAEIKTTKFPVPDIQMGDGNVIHVKNSAGYGIHHEKLGKERMKGFLEYGVLDKKSPFEQTHFLVPDTMAGKKEILEDFQNKIISLVKKVSNQDFPLRIIPYQASDFHTQREQFGSIKKTIDEIGIRSGCLMVLLPTHSRRGLHNQLKKEYHKTYWMQCAKEDKLLSFFRKHVDRDGNTTFQVIQTKEKKYNSYVRYFVLGLLQVHRRWISCLNDPLHYDLHIGIDVLNDFWGFTFVYQGGRHCYFDSLQRLSSQQDYKEKIPIKKIYEMIYTNLKNHLSGLTLKPKSLLIHRDGRTYDSEIHGLEQAVQHLIQDGYLPADIVFGIVEIHKSSAAKLRIIEKHSPASQYENPVMGRCYFYGAFRNEAAIATTGYPFSKSGNNPFGFDGTAQPLIIKAAYGNIELSKVAQDIFSLACLAWSAPDKASRLHLPIKLGDDYLEPIASKIEDDDLDENIKQQDAEISESEEDNRRTQ